MMARPRVRQITLFMFTCMLMITTTGCWDRRELDDLAIGIGLGIDMEGTQYKVSAQVVVPQEASLRASRSGSAPVTLYKATAPTIYEALLKLTETSPRQFYPSHLRILVLGESLARQGIADVLDVLIRDPKFRTNYFTLVSHETSAEDVLEIFTSLETLPANKLYDSLDVSSKVMARTNLIQSDELIDKLVNEGVSPVLTGIQIIGEQSSGRKKTNLELIDSPTVLRYKGLAVFRKDKLVAWLDEEQSKGYNYITNNVSSSIEHLECSAGGIISIENIRSNTKTKVIMENGKPRIELQVDNIANIVDVPCKESVDNYRTLKRLANEVERKTVKILEDTIKDAQERYKTDIFGFGQAISQTHPKVWASIKNDWNELFPQLQVDCNAKVLIKQTGMTIESVNSNLKED